MYSTSVISNRGAVPVIDRKDFESCVNCGTKLNVLKERAEDKIPCPVCGQVINSKGKILKDGRNLSLPQIC